MASNKDENSKRLLRQSIAAADVGEKLTAQAMTMIVRSTDPPSSNPEYTLCNGERMQVLAEARAWIELSIELVVSSENI